MTLGRKQACTTHARPVIYEYDRISDFIQSMMSWLKNEHPLMSYRWMCKKYAIKSPAAFSHVINGRRLPTHTLLVKLSEAFSLSDQETEYAQTLLALEKAVTSNHQLTLKKRLAQLRPNSKLTVIDTDQFAYISKWYHIAILEMSDLEGFCDDISWIKQRLRFPVFESEITSALKRLIRMGLLTRSVNGQLKRTDQDFVLSSQTPNTGIRMFHRNMILLANQAIESQDVDERVLTGQTMTIKKDKLPEAKKLIDEFMTRMRDLMPENSGDATYHLGLQYFKISDLDITEECTDE